MLCWQQLTGARPLFHFTNPILHPPCLPPLYISPFWDHVTESVLFHQEVGQDLHTWVWLPCARSSLCVLKPGSSVTGGGGGRTQVGEEVEAAWMTEATWASPSIQAPLIHPPHPEQWQKTCSYVLATILLFTLSPPSPIIMKKCYLRAQSRLYTHVNRYVNGSRRNELTHRSIQIASPGPCCAICKTVELSMRYWQLDWSRSDKSITHEFHMSMFCSFRTESIANHCTCLNLFVFMRRLSTSSKKAKVWIMQVWHAVRLGLVFFIVMENLDF